jgi:YbbR domain-containing protein
MRDWLTKDFWWKFFSVVLAVIIWLTVHKIYEEPRTPGAAAATASTFTYNNLPVTVVSASGDVHDFRVTPTSVKVTISGPVDSMNALQIGHVHAVVDLTDTNLVRDSRLPVEISAPTNVTITGIDPASVLVIIPPAPDKKP